MQAYDEVSQWVLRLKFSAWIGRAETVKRFQASGTASHMKEWQILLTLKTTNTK